MTMSAEFVRYFFSELYVTNNTISDTLSAQQWQNEQKTKAAV